MYTHILTPACAPAFTYVDTDNTSADALSDPPTSAALVLAAQILTTVYDSFADGRVSLKFLCAETRVGMYMHMYMYMYMYMYMCMCMGVYVYIYVYVYVYVYVYMSMRMCIYVYVYVCMYVHVHR